MEISINLLENDESYLTFVINNFKPLKQFLQKVVISFYLSHKHKFVLKYLKKI